MTPKELMISRYEAFKRLDGEYLQQTTTQDISTDLSGYENIEWLKLDVLEAKGDEVEFKAYYRENTTLSLLHEKSKFVQVEGEWKYEDGILYNTKIERNEDCPCGSGKKYKKCCMRVNN